MSVEQILRERSQSTCELCGSDQSLSVYEVPPVTNPDAESSILICQTCSDQINQSVALDPNHWRCLNDSMWSQVAAVKVMAWRMLNRLKAESWAQDLLDMLYLEDEVRQWAESGASEMDEDDTETTRDSNGAVLKAGDTVTLIKDLVVKGANFTAKRGTAVRNISLTSNSEHIEGRVNGVRIVLLTSFLKKA